MLRQLRNSETKELRIDAFVQKLSSIVDKEYPQNHYEDSDQAVAYVFFSEEHPAQDHPKDEAKPFYRNHVSSGSEA